MAGDSSYHQSIGMLHHKAIKKKLLDIPNIDTISLDDFKKERH